VGVIFSLGVYFGKHVLLPEGASGGIEWFYVAMSVLAFIALWRLKWDILWVIALSAGVGLVYTLAGLH